MGRYGTLDREAMAISAHFGGAMGTEVAFRLRCLKIDRRQSEQNLFSECNPVIMRSFFAQVLTTR